MIWSISFAIFLGLIALWIRWRVKMTSVFSNLGVPGPTPSLLFGNLIELYKKGPLRCHDDWIKKYGKVVGFYEGMKPVLLIAEPELLKSVLMKDFHNFTDRPEVIPLKGKKEDIFSKELINLKGQRWKEVRSILTPTFSTAKLKQMTSIISHTVDIFISKVKKKSECGEFFDIYDLYQRLTTDVIERTALGMDTGVQEKDHDPLLQSAQLIFRMKFADPLSFMGLCFPGLRPLAFFLMVIFIRVKNEGYLPGWRIIEGCEKIINERRADSTKRVPDLLQLMLDAEVSRNDLQNITNDKLTAGNDDVTSDKKSPDHAVDDEQRKKRSRYMTDDEIKANALIVFLAGYETTSSALAYTTYLLAKHPEVQNQVREELDNHMNDENKLDYSILGRLQYLDQVLSESMRVYPPVILFINRMVQSRVKYGNVTIPEGIQIQVPVYHLHHSSEYWDDPEKFDPTRFSPENRSSINPMVYQAFGQGPRNCIGIRFAQMEAKLALAKLLYWFELTLDESPEEKLSVQINQHTLTPEKGVFVKAIPRR